MTTKVIIIENRRPRTKHERGLYAESDFPSKGIVKIFINTDMNKRGADLADTIFHELTHAVIDLYHTKISSRKEEALCRKVGELVTEAFKNA